MLLVGKSRGYRPKTDSAGFELGAALSVFRRGATVLICQMSRGDLVLLGAGAMPSSSLAVLVIFDSTWIW